MADGPLDTMFASGFPVLETERLVLRELRPGDAVGLHAMFCDPEMMRYWGPPHGSAEDTIRMVTLIIESFAARTGIEWAITAKPNDTIIGKLCHHRLIKPHFRSEVGYMLARDRWGQGIMHEALKAIIAFGFDRMGLHSIEAQVDPRNARSVRVLERLGFVQEAHLRENYFLDGSFVDTAIYSLLVSALHTD